MMFPQVKFYQGMLKQKGTKSAVDKLVRSKFDTIFSDVQFYEEWAIRTGSMVLIQLTTE